MSIITDPYKTFKDQALKIWDTKDFAERLAFSTNGWIQSILIAFLLVTFLHFFISVSINDLFTLADFYSGDSYWFINFFQQLWQQTAILQLALLFFWTCPRIVRFSLTLLRAYNKKEKGIFNWIETKTKQRFPEYKTSAQKTRERAKNPRKPNKLQTWIRRQPPLQRRLIRISIASGYGIFMFIMLGMVMYPDMMMWILTGEERVREIPPQPTLEEQLENQPMPNKPDNRPPPTIYDIFIKQSTSVIP